MSLSSMLPKPTIYKEFHYQDVPVCIASGHIAMQSASSVMLSMGDCIVMVNVARQACSDESRDFFPLMVNYKARFDAAGKIPGGFTRREGRPNENEVIICRLIDRSIRPMFPKSFKDEVQVTVSLLQYDPNVEPDIPAMLATSAALALTDMPYKPVASARIGYINQQYVLNTPTSQQPNSRLDLVISGTKDSCIMVESSAMEITEQEVLGAIDFGQKALQEALDVILSLQNDSVGGSGGDKDTENTLVVEIEKNYASQLKDVFSIHTKSERNTAKSALHADILSTHVNEQSPEKMVREAISTAERKYVRGQILNKQARIDGRKHDEIRPITSCIRVLPKGPHGSALFTRGETQALVTVTMGGDSDAQLLDEVQSSSKDPFMLQYNFPPYSVGECGMATSPKRREIGHGKLARKAIAGVLPNQGEEFPYTLRVVSEVLSSNGSSSMATVCGTSLALMDAGVPIKDSVAGIAMGLVVENDQYTVLSDILGDEDHLGDMDFKVAGTKHGITALQMDIKVNTLPEGVLTEALNQAHAGRLHILNEMNNTITTSRSEYAPHAPQMKQVQIAQSKISAVIGRGGATIKELIEKYQVSIDINDNGLVKVSGSDSALIDQAIDHIQKLAIEIKIDQVYEGKVVKLMDFGAFVNIVPGKDAFLHISQIASHRVEDIQSELSEGQIVRVKVVEIDEKQKRVKVTMRQVPQDA